MSILTRCWPGRLTRHGWLREELLRAYDGPGRHYHDTRHLAEVLEHVDLLLGQDDAAAADGEAVLLAAWYHDAVYAGRPDDEERSAVLAESRLASAGAPVGLVAEVGRLVRLTSDHRPEPDDPSGRVLCDADLAVLAAPSERYDEYARDVRREYAHLDDRAFRDGRAAVLRALLERPVLFHTELARASWEERARANVSRELAREG